MRSPDPARRAPSRRAATGAADRLGAEVDEQPAHPRSVQMARAERLAALDTRSARYEIEPHATELALGGHLRLHEDANPLRHRSVVAANVLTAFCCGWRWCSSWPASTRRSRRSCSGRRPGTVVASTTR